MLSSLPCAPPAQPLPHTQGAPPIQHTALGPSISSATAPSCDPRVPLCFPPPHQQLEEHLQQHRDLLGRYEAAAARSDGTHSAALPAPLPLNRLRFAIKFHPNQLGWQTCTSRVGFAVCSTKTPCHVRCSTAITRLLPTPTTAGHSAASQTSGLQILVPTLPHCTAAPRSATDPTMAPTAARPILKPRTNTAGLCSGATKSHSVNRKAVRAHSEARRAFSLPPPQDARLTCWHGRSGAVREGPSQHRGVVGCLRGAARAPGGAAFLSARRQRSHAQGKRPHAAVSPQPGGPHGGAARLRPALPL